ncbi:hypothetical protein E2C01_095344 [Portunus trituberculatus]|uniref:Uncharacterized protein n=1 Tax=Portunus trituberculatus TaxID=210409 RepID=A0A5B7JYH0_PORTR|nr:hypothetical protein [Portunus trituberculatus]
MISHRLLWRLAVCSDQTSMTYWMILVEESPNAAGNLERQVGCGNASALP